MDVNKKSLKFTFIYLIWLVATIFAVTLISCSPSNDEVLKSDTHYVHNLPFSAAKQPLP